MALTMNAADLARIKAVFFDIDDTFSSEGKILPEAFDALWMLHRAGIRTIPVTGRPAGWCDMIARFWPVDAVVAENGAFYSYMDKAKGASYTKLVKKYLESESVRKKNAARLSKLKTQILKKFKGAKTPSDQAFREFDLAIDYCEDVARWPEKKVSELLDFARSKGAIAKLSSIHVNIWYGRYDKWTCVSKLMKERLGLDPVKDLDKVAYLGDSPNDEPFFERLPITIGVANVKKFLPAMKYHPKYITSEEGGLGFAEFARILKGR